MQPDFVCKRVCDLQSMIEATEPEDRTALFEALDHAIEEFYTQPGVANRTGPPDDLGHPNRPDLAEKDAKDHKHQADH